MATDTITTTKDKPKAGKPKWLRVKLPTGQKYTQLRSLVDKYNLKPKLKTLQIFPLIP